MYMYSACTSALTVKEKNAFKNQNGVTMVQASKIEPGGFVDASSWIIENFNLLNCIKFSDTTSHLQNSICHQLLPATLQFQRSPPSFCNNVIISNPNQSLLKKKKSTLLPARFLIGNQKKICLTLWCFAFTRLPHLVVEQNTTQVLLESASLWL